MHMKSNNPTNLKNSRICKALKKSRVRIIKRSEFLFLVFNSFIGFKLLSLLLVLIDSSSLSLAISFSVLDYSKLSLDF